METTLESPVATVAKEMLEDIKRGRKRNVKLGSQIPVASSLPKKKLYKISTNSFDCFYVDSSSN